MPAQIPGHHGQDAEEKVHHKNLLGRGMTRSGFTDSVTVSSLSGGSPGFLGTQWEPEGSVLKKAQLGSHEADFLVPAPVQVTGHSPSTPTALRAGAPGKFHPNSLKELIPKTRHASPARRNRFLLTNEHWPVVFLVPLSMSA